MTFICPLGDGHTAIYGLPFEPIVFMRRPPTPKKVRQILSVVSTVYGIPKMSLLGVGRFRSFAWPRFALYLLCAEFTGYSIARIGVYIGGRDPSTITHGIKRATEMRENNPEFAALYARCRRVLA